jgi:hypothetical protein
LNRMRQRIQLPETSVRAGVKHRGKGVKHPTEARQCSLLAHPQETWLLASDRRRRPQDARLNVSRAIQERGLPRRERRAIREKA